MLSGALCSIVFVIWCAQDNHGLFEFHFTHPNGTEIENFSEHCKANDCVVKCCPEQQVVFDQSCTDSMELTDIYGVKDLDSYSDINVYGKNIQEKVTKTNKTANHLKFIYDANFSENAIKIIIPRNRGKTFLLEDGTFVFYRANYWRAWAPVFKRLEFCIDHEVYSNGRNETLASTDVLVWMLYSDKPSSNSRAIFAAPGLLVSCVFLLLVLAVYALLPELRNPAGLMLMACMATYFAFFLTRVIHVYLNQAGVLTQKDNGCQILIIIFYYLMLATFSWMNVMSFDIWRTFRDVSKCPQMSQFRWYCAYAWGMPALPTIFVVITELSDLTHLPNFVKLNLWDNFCLIEPEARLLYFHLPILVMICVNLGFFLMTAINIWKVKRGVSRYICHDHKNKKTNENRFWTYLRLSLLMGVSWILEVISNFVGSESLAWCIPDLYNALIGVLIFLTFVCKKKIFLRLCTRFSIDNKLVRSMRARAEESRPPGPAKSPSLLTETNDLDGRKEISGNI